MSTNNSFNGFGAPVSLYKGIAQEHEPYKIRKKKRRRKLPPITSSELEKLKLEYINKRA